MASPFSKPVLLITWLTALSGLTAISVHYVGHSTRFFGIADDQEQTIRFTTGVRILGIGVVPGQEVAAGDRIVEVTQLELDTDLRVIDEQIQALRFEDRDARASMSAQVRQITAELEATLTGIDSQIRSLQARNDAARTLFDGLGDGDTYAGDGVIAEEIDGLRRRKQALKRSAHAQINDLQSRLATSERPVDAQIAELENRRQELLRQRGDLTVHAQIGGRVGSVLFKPGDTVPPYQPVLTLHGTRPTFVKGYIHENVLNDIRLNQAVWVQAAHSPQGDIWQKATVESLGSRIVEFPARLKVNPLTQAWGREVVVRLNNDHSLLMGERVNVRMNRPGSAVLFLRSALAEVRK